MGMIAVPRLQIHQLDSRYTGHRHFKHRVKVLGDYVQRYQHYIKIRNWCWNTWGPSQERDIYLELAAQDKSLSIQWAWHTERHNQRFSDNYIYLATDTELSVFYLKWC